MLAKSKSLSMVSPHCGHKLPQEASFAGGSMTSRMEDLTMSVGDQRFVDGDVEYRPKR